jgi:hypothetical protein
VADQAPKKKRYYPRGRKRKKENPVADQSPPQKQTNPQPQQPAQQPPQQGAQPAQALDWNKLQQLIAALGTYGPVLYQAFLALVQIMQNQPPVMQAKAVKCGPDGDDDHGDCCRAALDHSLQTTAHLIHLQCCCDEGRGD